MKKLQKQLKTAKKIQQLLADNPEVLQLALSGKTKSKKKTRDGDAVEEEDDDLAGNSNSHSGKGMRESIKVGDQSTYL